MTSLNSFSVFAESGNNSSTTENEIKTYIDNIVPYHLLALGLESEYDVTEPIVLHDWDNYIDDKYISVVIDDVTDKMVGTITCAKFDDEITSSFSTVTFSKIDEMINGNIPFQLGGSKGCFILFDGTEYTILENEDNVDESFTQNIISDFSNEQPAEIMFDNVNAKLNSRSVTYSTNTPPLVVNSTNADNDKGLCWAACVASKGACQTQTTAKTANQIYTMCKNSTGADRPDGDPVGTVTWTQYALAHCFSLNPGSNDALTNSDIIAKLNSNRPIICFVESITKYYDTDGDGVPDKTSQHGVLLWSLVSLDNNNGTIYVYMDPGSSSAGAGMVSQHKTDTTDSSSISIVSKNGKIYSVWNKAVY